MSVFGWITLGATVVLVISVTKSRSAENILDHDLAGGCYAVATIALTVMAISGALTVFI